MSQKIYSNLDIKGNAKIGDITNATSDTDKFLVSDAGVVKYRTGSEILSDLGISNGFIPYIGATQDVDLGSNQLKADSLAVSTTSIEPVNIGEIVWNQVDGTFDMGLVGGVTLQAGQEMHIYGKSTETISNGNAVMFAGVQGDHILIAKADAATINNNPEYFIGIATQDFSTNDFGYITVFGNVRGLNTTAYTLGTVLYYNSASSTDGLLTSTTPTAPNAKIEVAAVVRVHATQGILLVRPHVMPKVKDLQDVYAPSASNNDGLFWNTSTNRYENKSIVSALGYTPVSQARTLTINGTTFDLSADRSWTIASGVTSFNTRTGAITLTSGDVTGALGYTPYNSSNPNGYISSYTETDTLASVTGRGATTNTLSTFDGGLNIGNAKLRWGGTTTPTLGFPFTGGPNGFWIDVNDGDTGGIVIDNDGTTIYGAGDTGHVFRVIDEDVYQSTSNIDASTTFRVQQGQNGGGYIKGNFDISGYITIGGSAYLASGNSLFFDSGITNDYSIRKNGTALQFDSGGDFTFNKGINILTTRDNALVLRAMDGGTNPWNYIEYVNSVGTRKYYVGTDTSNVFNIWSDDGTGYVHSNTSFRSPIFYDSDNTAYYLNPASTSNLLGLTVTNTITGSVSGSAANLSGSINSAASGISSMKINDTRYWVNDPNAPGNYFQALTLGNGSDFTQIGVNSSQQMYFRFNGASNVWNNVLSSNNYSSYAVPLTRTITINGTSYDLSANRSWTVTANAIETDTLQTVTSRGNVTTTSITANSVIIPSFETATNVLSFRSGIPDGTNVGIRAKATVTANRDGLELLGYNGIDFSINNGNTVAGKFNNYGQFLVNATSSGYGPSSYGYNLGMRGTTSQAYMSIALSNQTLDTQGLIIGIDSSYARFHVRDSKAISFANGDVERMTLDTSANLIANGSVRAPIFYDSNDTGYYLDPASTSNLALLSLYGHDNQLKINTYSGGASGWFAQEAGVNKWETYHYQGRYRWYSYTTNQEEAFFDNASGYFQVRTSVRAPIFYDSNNTGYYIDPSNTSNINTAIVNGLLSVAGSTGNYNEGIRLMSGTGSWSNIQFGANTSGAGTQANQWIVGKRPDGNFVMSLAGNQDGGSRFLIDQGGSTQAPTYYDGNDTGYYLNPAGDSNVSALYANNWFRAKGDSGFYSQDYGGHIRRSYQSSYGTWEIFGYNKGGYAGMNIYDAQGYTNNYMHESGNGGLYLENQGGAWAFYWSRGNACIGLGGSGTSSSYKAYVNGGLYATGDIVAYSDRRKKENIVTIDNALKKVLNLRGVYYDKIDELEKGRRTGVIAQEIQEILPEVVTYAEDNDEYGVAYGNIVGVLIEAIKEQQSQIEELKELVNQLIKK